MQLPQLMKAGAENLWNNGNETESLQCTVCAHCCSVCFRVTLLPVRMRLRLVIITTAFLIIFSFFFQSLSKVRKRPSEFVMPSNSLFCVINNSNPRIFNSQRWKTKTNPHILTSKKLENVWSYYYYYYYYYFVALWSDRFTKKVLDSF